MKIFLLISILPWIVFQTGCRDKEIKNCETIYTNKEINTYRQLCSDKDSTFVVYKINDPPWITYKYKINDKYFIEIFSINDTVNRAYYLEINPCKFNILVRDRPVKNGMDIEYQGPNNALLKTVTCYKNDSLDGQRLHFNDKGILDWVQMFKKDKLVWSQDIQPSP